MNDVTPVEIPVEESRIDSVSRMYETNYQSNQTNYIKQNLNYLILSDTVAYNYSSWSYWWVTYPRQTVLSSNWNWLYSSWEFTVPQDGMYKIWLSLTIIWSVQMRITWTMLSVNMTGWPTAITIWDWEIIELTKWTVLKLEHYTLSMQTQSPYDTNSLYIYQLPTVSIWVINK